MVTLAFLWEKLSQGQFYEDLTRIFWGVVLVQVQQFGTGNRYDLEIYSSMAKGLKVKVRKSWGLSPMFVEATREKLVGEGGAFWPPHPE